MECALNCTSARNHYEPERKEAALEEGCRQTKDFLYAKDTGSICHFRNRGPHRWEDNSSTKDKGITRKSDFHRSTRSSVRFNAACKYL